MPKADLPIHENVTPRVTTTAGISVREDILFTNPRGEEKRRIRRRNEKLLKKLQPPLLRFLLPDKVIFSIARCQSPLNILEQITAGWWTALLEAAAVVITNKRIFFFPVTRSGSWRESVRSAQWGDLAEAQAKGWLFRSVSFRSRSGKKETYTRFGLADSNKIALLAAVLIVAGAGEQSPARGIVSLCPDCRNALTPGVYFCSACGLIFKNEKDMIVRSIFLPGGGYFYTGHPLIAILPTIAEIILILEMLVLVITGLTSNQAKEKLIGVAVAFGVVWVLETAVTILHCRRYIREFIPDKRDPTRLNQALSSKIGS